MMIADNCGIMPELVKTARGIIYLAAFALHDGHYDCYDGHNDDDACDDDAPHYGQWS